MPQHVTSHLHKVILLFALWVISPTSIGSISANQCYETRAIFDIGSYTTTVIVARVDQCRKKINKVLFNKKISTPYREHILGNKKNKISKKFQVKGIKTILKLKRQNYCMRLSKFL